MPTATMTFALPDEQHEFEIHTHAADFAAACWQVDDKCRAFVKWPRLHLGHRSVGLAEKSYLDWAQIRTKTPRAPSLVD